MAASPAIGSIAPDFTLPGTVLKDGRPVRGEYTLSAHRGHPLLLVFYPGDETPGCTAQLCEYSSGLGSLSALGAEVWAVSRQDVVSHEHFARKEGLELPLLADETGSVVSAYGVSLAGVGTRRSEFLIDADGVVRWKRVGILGVHWSSVDALHDQLALVSP
ncbi:peroxiredoxin [Agromyces atrinae]|uniref:thioredoxin-dependent peroxiredoxin n=1 Tax=Agromyces atrinae TaxID=592376 RepID=A0A4Q2M1X8_9MICO|nr:peroxiredoxin [Agromyces atrinae]MCI2959259.1 peroxiredoxin [Agromyces atrinae]NYD65522.1 peroxiredoxin Q/BCP [Agromyces atrinae]RXZ85749.1 peroxiredoxin [Agromyces atrinae]